MGITTDLFRQSMALFPGAVTLITTGREDERRGITATAVCSVSDSPPRLLVCVNQKTATCMQIRQTGRFSVQLLDDTSDEIALAFPGARKLEGAAKFGWVDGPTLPWASRVCCAARRFDGSSDTPAEAGVQNYSPSV